MLEEIYKYLFKKKRSKGIKYYYYNLFYKNKKLQEYKKNQKNSKKEKRNRKKINIQLKLNFNGKKIKRFILVIVIILTVIIIILIRGPFFRVENINIIRLDENVNIRLIESKINSIKGKFLFSVGKEPIESKIKEIEQNIKNIFITKIPPSTINIKISSHEPIFETTLKGNKYLITDNGVFIPTNKKNTEKTKIIIKNLELENYPNYKKILKIENLYKIKYLEKNLKENIVNLEIQDIIYYKRSREVHFIINNKTRLIFDLNEREDWGNDEKLKQIFVFNKERIGLTKQLIIYIDNRVKGKIFYCQKEDVKQCIKNINYIYDEFLKETDYNQETEKNN